MILTEDVMPLHLRRDWGAQWKSRCAADLLENYALAQEAPPEILFYWLQQGRGPESQARTRFLGGLFQRSLMSSHEAILLNETPVLPMHQVSLAFIEMIAHETEQQIQSLARIMGCERRDAIRKTEAYLYALPPLKHQDRWLCKVRSEIEKYTQLPFPCVEVKTGNEYASFSRKWYRHDKGLVLLSNSKLPGPIWAVQQGIHDCAHLLHLSFLSRWRHGLMPEQILISEGLAMAMEWHSLKTLTSPFNTLTQGTDVNPRDLELTLRLGILERCLRVDYDKAIHREGLNPERWRQELAEQMEMDLSQTRITHFAERFWGLPGLATGYMAAMYAILNCSDLLAVLQGFYALDFTHILEINHA